MKKILSLLTLLILLNSTSYSQNYTIDSGHTAVTSKVVRFGVIPVLGRFNDASGIVYYDANSIEKTTARILIKTGSYVANNPDGEEAVKGQAFLNTEAYPEMIFEVIKLWRDGEELVAVGTLELHGTKKEISFPVSIVGPMIDLPTRKQSIGITGELTINRLDYGVGAEMKLPNGTEIIGNNVVIEFYVLALSN